MQNNNSMKSENADSEKENLSTKSLTAAPTGPFSKASPATKTVPQLPSAPANVVQKAVLGEQRDASSGNVMIKQRETEKSRDSAEGCHMEALCASMEELILHPLPEIPKADISTLIEVDTNYLNFGSFYPGKIFKCTIAIRNLTDSARSVSLSYDDTPKYSQSTLLRMFATSGTRALPPLLQSLPELPNSEFLSKCWYFMRVQSKAFDKRLAIAVPPMSTVQIGVVIKSPCITKSEKFYSVVKVGLAPGDPEADAVDPAHEDLRVVSVAEVVTPRLECCCELMHLPSNLRIVPLVVKMEGAVQRMRVPFKNAGTRDLDLQLTVVKFPGRTDCEESEVEYHCMPGTVKIQAGSMGLVTIGISQPADDDCRLQKDRRLLIAKVKDTQMMYSYILDCTFIY